MDLWIYTNRISSNDTLSLQASDLTITHSYYVPEYLICVLSQKRWSCPDAWFRVRVFDRCVDQFYGTAGRVLDFLDHVPCQYCRITGLDRVLKRGIFSLTMVMLQGSLDIIDSCIGHTAVIEQL